MIPSTKSGSMDGTTVTSATPGEVTSQSAFKRYGIGGAKLVGLAVLFTVVSIGVDAAREAIFHTKRDAAKAAEDKANADRSAQRAENEAARKDLASQIGKVVVEGVGQGIAAEVVKGITPSIDRVKEQLIEMNGNFVGLRDSFRTTMEDSTRQIVGSMPKTLELDDASIQKLAKAFAKASA